MLRYMAGYVLDFFRERVTADDFGGQPILRVLLTPGLDESCQEAIRHTFASASFHLIDPRAGLIGIRRQRFDAACIAMAGGPLRARGIGLFSGARHKLLVPSADYLYRFGIRRGPLALAWAILDRFLLAPVALLWFLLVAAWLYLTHLPRRARRAEG
jgi:hypothetical protein